MLYVRGMGRFSQVHTAGPSLQVHLDSAASPTRASALSGGFIYYTLKDPKGFMLARARKGPHGEPLSSPQPLTLLGDSFGQAESDSISALQLSPDGQYVVVDGSSDHGDMVWVYDVQHATINQVPANVTGNFLNWIPGGNGHSFLYRPMFPMGPGAPMNGNGWNPGLWIVDAATNNHTNIDINLPSADLVDAASSPDGSHIIYSTTPGLGMGSDVWEMSRTGGNRAHLFGSTGDSQTIAGLFTWSPDGSRIAYEMLAGGTTPFQPASLWVMNSDGTGQRRLGTADGGHGFGLSWSPDSRKIAFVVRTNDGNHYADAQAQALQCGIAVVNVDSRHSWLVASAQQTGMQWNIHPTWAASSADITFTAQNPTNRALGGTPRYWSAHAVDSAGPPLKSRVVPLSPAIPHVVAAG